MNSSLSNGLIMHYLPAYSVVTHHYLLHHPLITVIQELLIQDSLIIGSSLINFVPFVMPRNTVCAALKCWQLPPLGFILHQIEIPFISRLYFCNMFVIYVRRPPTHGTFTTAMFICSSCVCRLHFTLCNSSQVRSNGALHLLLYIYL